jgi:hypothetical protein
VNSYSRHNSAIYGSSPFLNHFNADIFGGNTAVNVGNSAVSGSSIMPLAADPGRQRCKKMAALLL